MLPGLESQVPYRDDTWNENAIVAEQVTHDVTSLRLQTSAPIVTMLEGSVSTGKDSSHGMYVIVGKCADVAKVLNGLTCQPGPAVYAYSQPAGDVFKSTGPKDVVTGKLPAQYETRPFNGTGRISGVIDPELLPGIEGKASMVGVPTTAENRDAVHTALVGTLPGVRLVDGEQRELWGDTLMDDLQRATIIGLSIAAVLGGIGAAVAAAGSVIDRRRTFGALIAAGTPIRVLGHALRREVMLPVFAVTIAACGAGIVVGLGLLTLARGLVGHGEMPLTLWPLAPVGVGMVVALVAALACGPVLRGISPRDYAAE
jgi:hypothetical protein